MPTQELKLGASWDEVKEKLKETNINLTDEDLVYQPGNENELLDRLQKKLNKPRDEIRMLIESLSVNNGKAG